MASRVIQKCSATEHPLMKKFIGNVDQAFLEKLSNYECYWNWVGPELTDKEMQVITRKYEATDALAEKNSEGTSFQSLIDDEIDAGGANKSLIVLNPASVVDLENNHSIKFLIKARAVAKKIFWLIYLDRIEEAGILLNEIRSQLVSAMYESSSMLVKENAIRAKGLCILSLSVSEVFEGCNYVLDGLEAYLMLKNGKCDQSLATVITKPEFEELPKKAQLVIVYFKLGFVSEGRKYFVDVIDTFKKLIEIDPKTSVWYHGLHFYCRLLRRQSSLETAPTAEETDAALKAYTLDPSSPVNISYICTDMAEIIRNNEKLSSKWPMEYGDEIYIRPDHMMKVIKEKAKELMKHEDSLIAAKNDDPFLALVALFSSILPFHYRDFELSEKLVDCALKIDPNCTVAIHRKALLIMKQDPTFDGRLEAEEILRQIKDEFAFYPLYDLLNLLFSDLNKNEEEIRAVLQENIAKNEIWNPIEISKLYFLKGCLNFMKKNYRQAFDDWIECLALDSKADHFGGILLAAARFAWSDYVLNFPNICKQLQNLAKKDFENDKWTIFEVMSKEIQSAAQKSSTWTSQARARNSWHWHQRQSQQHFDRSSTSSWRSSSGNDNFGTGSSAAAASSRLPMAAISPSPRYVPERTRKTSFADDDGNWRKK